MDFWRIKTLSIGSPFRNIDSGRSTEADSENNRRFKIGEENYLKQFREKHNIPAEFDWYTENAYYALPLATGAVTFSLLLTYTRPASVWLRGVGTAVAIFAGFQIGVRQKKKKQAIFLLKNYKNFDQCFKDALQTGDARYLVDYIPDLKKVRDGILEAEKAASNVATE